MGHEKVEDTGEFDTVANQDYYHDYKTVLQLACSSQVGWLSETVVDGPLVSCRKAVLVVRV